MLALAVFTKLFVGSAPSFQQRATADLSSNVPVGCELLFFLPILPQKFIRPAVRFDRGFSAGALVLGIHGPTLPELEFGARVIRQRRESDEVPHAFAGAPLGTGRISRTAADSESRPGRPGYGSLRVRPSGEQRWA